VISFDEGDIGSDFISLLDDYIISDEIFDSFFVQRSLCSHGHTAIVSLCGATTGGISATLGATCSEVQRLDQPRHSITSSGRANARGGTFVVNTEDSLSSIDEGSQITALSVLRALLVEGPIEVGNEGSDLVEIVLQSNRQSALVGLRGEEAVEIELSGGGETQSIAVGISVNVIRLNTITSLRNSQVQTSGHNRAKSSIASIGPSLSWPVVEVVTKRGGGEGGSIWSPVLILSAEIANNNTSSGVEGSDEGGGGVEQINIVHLHVQRLIDGSSELPLPSGEGRGRPHLTSGANSSSSRGRICWLCGGSGGRRCVGGSGSRRRLSRRCVGGLGSRRSLS
jgi:hypothetical protein